MYRYLVILLSFGAAGLAQDSTAPPSAFQYLGLTSQQVASVNNANREYARYQAEKQTRMAQVQVEIAQETAKSPLDPMALGLRYVELEVIRRELADQLTKTRETIVAVLSDAQRTKLKTLEDAAKLQTTVSDAQCQNLLPSTPSVSGFLTGALVGSGGTVLVPAPLCGRYAPLAP